MHVALRDYGIFLDTSYWRVTGFQVRYFGTTAAASGITFRGAIGCEALNNYLLANAGRPVFMRVMASDNLVYGNLSVDPRITPGRGAVKGHDEEGASLLNRAGRGNVISTTHARGVRTAFAGGGDYTTGRGRLRCRLPQQLPARTSRRRHRDRRLLGDQRARDRQQVLQHLQTRSSIAPITQGPYYCLRNLFVSHGRAGQGVALEHRAGWMVHNTFSSTSGAVHPPACSRTCTSGTTSSRLPAVDDDAAIARPATTSTATFCSRRPRRSSSGKATNYTSISTLRGATGFEVLARP